LATETPLDKSEFPASRFETVTGERSLAVPLLLVGGLLVALITRLLLVRAIETPWIMIDELIYSELAKSFADSGDFAIRDGPRLVNSLGYPALIAPAWFAQSVGTSYEVARAINVLAMVLAAVPVYLWGRRMMSPAYAALASALVLLMPSLIYTGMLMTENAFFIVSVATSYAMALTLERPTLLRQVLVLVGIAVTCIVRIQALVLVPIYAVALALKIVLDLRAPGGPRGLRQVLGELRRYLLSAAVLLVVGGGYVAMNLLQGAPLEEVLGGYGGVVKVEYDVSSAVEWTIDHFAELTFSVAVIPVSALIVLLGLGLRGRATSPAERAFLAVTTSAIVLTVIEVGIFASRFALRVEERNMFSVAPLLFLALSLWLARGLPRPLVLTAAAALAPAALLLTLPLGRLLNIGVLSDTFGLVPLYRLVLRPDVGVDTVRLLMLGGGLAAALAFALLPRRLARVALPSAVALVLALASLAVFDTIRDHSRATLAITGANDPSWIDEEIGSESEAAFLYTANVDPLGEAQILWQTEFWNRSVEPVYRLGPPEPAPLSSGVAGLDRLTGRVTLEPAPSSGSTYVVVPSSLQLSGALLAQTPRLALYRAEQPMRFRTMLEGVYADGWMINDATFTQYVTPSGRPGRLRVRVSRESWRGPSVPGRVTLRVGSVVARDGQPAIGRVTSSRTWTVRSRVGRTFLLETPRPPFRLEIHTGSTFSPGDTGSPDTRRLGAQIELELVS
jgi:hypothetical protein